MRLGNEKPERAMCQTVPLHESNCAMLPLKNTALLFTQKRRYTEAVI